ncbi:hypothetical protein FHS86_003441 [Roseimarinus sediminis]
MIDNSIIMKNYDSLSLKPPILLNVQRFFLLLMFAKLTKNNIFV